MINNNKQENYKVSRTDRLWEIDFFRGIAIVLMVIFHTIVDLKDFYGYDIDYMSGFWSYVGKLSAILFILISGISSTFSKNNIKRGIIVFSFGMLLTLVTYIYDQSFFIRFGILHFLGISMILYGLISRAKLSYLLVISVAAISLGQIFDGMTVNTPFLFPIGLRNDSFSSLDYYPLLPWFGLFLIGVLIGKTIYTNKKAIFNVKVKYDPLSYLGKHSLFIYLIHQPVILVLLHAYHMLAAG